MFWYVYPGNTCHLHTPLSRIIKLTLNFNILTNLQQEQYLALPLLMSSINADNPDNTTSFYNLTISTNFFNRGSNFHYMLLYTICGLFLKISFFHQPIILLRHDMSLHLRNKIHHNYYNN